MSCSPLEMEKKSPVRLNPYRIMRNWLIWLYLLAALVSSGTVIVFWFTNIFRNAVVSNLELRNGTPAFGWWQNPPVGLIYKVYIFNYTNVKEFESGAAAKLRVQEVGPYIYKETLSRVNVETHANGTVTYQEQRSFEWIGGSSEDDRVVVPSVPLLSTVAYLRDISYFAQVSLTALLTTMGSSTFSNLRAGGYIWGYDDKIFEMAKPIMALKKPVPFDKFGILAFRSGVSKDRITVHSGVGNLGKLGMIQRLNGMDKRDVWGDDRCDRIFGTDGSLFPPHWIQDTSKMLYIYAKDMCRILPFYFEGRNNSRGIPTLRYKLPPDVFTASKTKDSCFCPKVSTGPIYTRRVCPPAGIFNVSTCGFDTPMLTSFPHFYLGDKSLLRQIDGLNPREELHETFFDLHPILGIPMNARSRLQMNLEVRTAVGMPFFGKLKDGMILPLVWVDTALGEVPDNLMDLLYDAHFTFNAINNASKWGSLVVLVLSLIALIFSLRQRRRHAMLKRNISGQDRLLTNR